MHEEGLISDSEYNQAISENITLAEQKSTELNDYQATFAMDCAVRYLMGLDGFNFKYHYDTKDEYREYSAEYDEKYEETKGLLYTNGYKIYTTLDSSAQKNLQSALDEVLSFDEETNTETGAYALQGALTAVDNINGKVIAVIGGRTNPTGASSTYTLNRGYQSYRQPGSTIKPVVVYTPALELGYAPGSIVENIDVTKAKTMSAIQALFMSGSSMTLRNAVEQSKNGCAWQVYANISPKAGLAHITDMEYQRIVPDDYNLATALGGFTNGVTTVEQAAAYSTLANHGVYRGQTCIASIKNNDDEELYVEPEDKQVYTAEAADTMVDIMKGVLTAPKATAVSLKWYSETKTEAAGKTGTTNGSKDGWFCGITPYYSIAVWVGYDQPRELANLYGATYPASIWKSAMLSLIDGYEAKTFELPSKMAENSYSEKYLPGREADEELSEGYTVANFRQDRTTAESIRAWNAQMTAVPITVDINAAYNENIRLVNTIVNKSFAATLLQEVNNAYAKGLSNITAVTIPSVTPDTAGGVIGGGVTGQ